MADFNSLVSQYLDASGVSDQKQAGVAATVEAKKAQLSGLPSPAELQSIGAALTTGKGQASASPLESDLRTLSPLQLRAKYGDDVAEQLQAGVSGGMADYRRMNTAERSDAQILGDTLSGGLLGFGGGLAGIGALGVGGLEKIGLAPAGAGATIAGFVGDASRGIQAQQSTGLNLHRQAGALRSALDERDHQAEREAAVKAGGSELIAGLRKIGQDTLSAVDNQLADPTLVSDGLANAAGSLYSGGVVGKGIKALGMAGAAKLAVGAQGPSRAAALLAGATEKAAMPAAIGALESGGVYQQTVEQALAKGATPTEANDAGLLAAAIQAPVAVATGSLVAKFEANPHAVPSLGSAAANLLKEAVEEGAQSGSGQLAQNIGLKTEVDPNQDLSEGVGEQIGQGALYGLGSAGVVQAPGTALHVALGSAKLGARALGLAKDSAVGAADRVLAKQDAKAASQASEIQSAAAAVAPELQTALTERMSATPMSPPATSVETAAETQPDHIAALFDAVKFDPAELVSQPEAVQTALAGANDRFDALNKAAELVVNGKSVADKQAAAGYLLNQLQTHEATLSAHLNQAVEQINALDAAGQGLSEDDPTFQRVGDFLGVLNAVRAHPTVQKALGWALQQAEQIAPSELSPAELQTPAGQSKAQLIVEQAEQAPETVKPELAELMLEHAAAGRISLTPAQIAQLKAASALVRASQARIDQAALLGVKLNKSQQTETETLHTGFGGGLKGLDGPGMAAHAKDVIAAVKAGDTAHAALLMQDMGHFAESLQRKVAALNKSAAKNGAVLTYQTLALRGPEGRELGQDARKRSTPLGLHVRKLGSVRNAQAVALDAKAAAELHNGMVAAFPELNGKPVAIVPLDIDPNLDQDGQKIVDAALKPKSTQAQVQAKPAQPAANPTSAVAEAQAPTQQTTSVDQEAKPVVPAEPEKRRGHAETAPAEAPASDEQPAVPAEGSEPLAKTFPGLLRAKDPAVGNRFLQAFTPAKGEAKLVQEADVLGHVSQALSSGRLAATKTGKAALSAYQSLLAAGKQATVDINARLNAEASKKYGHPFGDKLVGELLLAGETQPFNAGRFLLLNLVQPVTAEGEVQAFEYQPQLLQTAVLAGIQWSLTMLSRDALQETTRADVAELLGVPKSQVTDAQLAMFNQSGSSLQQAKASLGEMIRRYWGVSADRNVDEGVGQSIQQGMAAEVLQQLHALGLLELYQMDQDGKEVPLGSKPKANADGRAQSFVFVRAAQDASAQQALTEARPYANAIEQLAVSQPEQPFYVGSAPPSVAKTQMNNPQVRNSALQRKAIETVQGEAHYPNVLFGRLLRGLKAEGVRFLFGAGELRPETTNVRHLASLRGKNVTLDGAFQTLEAMWAQAEAYAAEHDLELSETPFHFAYNFSRVNRLHMLGAYTPQSVKLLREFVLPTVSTVDLTDPAQLSGFRLALAQALDVKVNKLIRANADAALDGKLAELAPVLDLLRTFVAEDGELTLNQDDAARIKDGFAAANIPLTPVALHAAIEWARFQQTADKTSFTTAMYVEADGVTDGMINAMVHLVQGAFSANWVERIRKGGLLLGGAYDSINAWFDHGRMKDLYETTSEIFSTLFDEHRRELPAKVTPHMQALEQVMDLLLPGVKLDGDQLVVDRGVVKNPLTIRVYNAGAKGIAGNIVDLMLDKLYELQTAVANGDKQANAQLNQRIAELKRLTETQLRTSEKGLWVKSAPSGNQTVWSSDPVRFTLNAQQVENLTENVLQLFIAPLLKAVSQTTGDIEAGQTLLRKGVQVPSIVLEHLYKAKVDAKIQAKQEQDPNYRPSFYLSKAEQDEILQSLKHLGPFVTTGAKTMTFYVAGSEKADLTHTTAQGGKEPIGEWGLTLDGKLKTVSPIQAPRNAGVAGAPNLTQGTGDGQQVLNAVTMDGRPEGGLPVFDGFHMKLSTLDQDSVALNQAVYDGWMQGNPLADVSQAYGDFLTNLDQAQLSEQAWNDLARALDGETLEELGQALKDAAEESTARHRALRRVSMTVDHMASVGQPYVHDGDIKLDGKNAQQIADALNIAYREELANLRSEPTPSEQIADELFSAGTQDEASGAQVVFASELRELVQSLNVPTAQKSLLGPLVRALSNTGWKLVLGDRTQADAYATAHGKRALPRTAGESHGVTAVGDQLIYLHSGSSETLVHELIHAATVEKVFAFYSQPKSLLPEERAAVERIERLMDQWLLGAGVGDLDPAARKAYQQALQAVNQALGDTRQALPARRTAALNEFMAWNLANQHLVRVGQRTSVSNPLAKITRAVLEAVKALFGGKGHAVPGSLYENLRFNTVLLLRSDPTVQLDAAELALSHSTLDPDLAALTRKFQSQVVSTLGAHPTPEQRAEQAKADALGAQASLAVEHAFPLAPAEAALFRKLVAAFATQAKLDPVALNRIQELYDHVMRGLTPTSFMVDPQANDPNDEARAQLKLAAISGIDQRTGKSIVQTDSQGRSTLLPVFLALAMVDPQFRRLLAGLQLPSAKRSQWSTVNEAVADLGHRGLEAVNAWFSGQGPKAANVQQALDALTNRVAEIQDDERDLLSRAAGQSMGLLRLVNDKFVDVVQDGAETVYDLADAKQSQTPDKATKLALGLVKGAAAIVHADKAADLAMGVIALANRAKLPEFVHSFLVEVVGRQDEIGGNAAIYDLIKPVRTAVSQLRQQFRTEVPKIIRQAFSRELSRQEWSRLTAGLIKTDLAALAGKFSEAQLLQLLADPGKVDAAIAKLEARLSTAQTARFPALQAKSRQLANFMVTGQAGGNLLANANAVANLFGESGALNGKAPASLVQAIDQLVSLYALQAQSQGVKDTLAELAKAEPKGLAFAVNYLVGQREDELAKASTPAAKFNHFKGYAALQPQDGASLLVADDFEAAKLRERGYVRVGDYVGDRNEVSSGKKGYYFTPASGRTMFLQGLMQNVRPTAYGVDPLTGFSYGPLTAGRITGGRQVKAIAQHYRGRFGAEPLRPIYGATGKVVGYERMVDPAQLARLNHDADLAKVVGQWRGRQLEESLAGGVNAMLVERLHAAWTQGQTDGREEEFVDLLDAAYLKANPVVADAVALFTPQTRELIKAAFGDSFMVRKDMLTDAIGHRQASVTDNWTGVSQAPPEVQKLVKAAGLAVMGDKAFTLLAQGEQNLQGAVRLAKDTVVVRSVIVPAANFLANLYQLFGLGVDPARMLKALPGKLLEINGYVGRQKRMVQLEAEHRAVGKDVTRRRKIEAELKAIDDANSRMSIWPLIQSGQFSSISSEGLEHDDQPLFQGKWYDYLASQVAKLPPQVQTAGRYALIAKDTPLYQGLKKAVDFGDFLAKAVLYDHLTEVERQDSETAIGRITDEFVNYDRLAGRSRSYLESIGALWFWNFKVRAMKTAVATIRHRPLTALLAGLMPAPDMFGTIGSPLTDNFLSVTLDGRLGYSIGPGMGLRSWHINPVANVLGL